MKKILLLVILMITACSNTEVIHVENNQAPVQELIIGNETSEVVGETPIAAEPSQKFISPRPELYDIMSCCNDGVMVASVKANEQNYSKDQMKYLLVQIYKENCDKFNETATKDTLRLTFLDQPRTDANNLVSYPNTKIGTVVARKVIEDVSFPSCR